MTANRIRTLILAVFSFLSLNLHGQNEFLGNQVFHANKAKEKFDFETYNAIVRIGNLVNDNSKNGIIFQQIDSINYIWQIKFLSYGNNEITEKIIDTVDMGTLVGLEFSDKDFDTNKDLVITIGGNKAVDFLYLFDEQENDLRFIEEFIDYPATKQVADSKFLYSYKAAGCADNYWKSTLIKIENFEVVRYGEISGNGCDESENSLIIQVNEEKTLMLDMKVLNDFPNGKFDFIEKFWNQKVASWSK